MTTVNYPASAANIEPDIAFGALPSIFDYDSLVWLSPVIPKAELEANWLRMEKVRIVAKLNADILVDVTAGFPSDALETGVFRVYDSTLQGQILVIGAVIYTMPHPGMTVASDYLVASADHAGQVVHIAHDHAQLYQLMTDLGVFSADMIQAMKTKIETVMSTNTGNVNVDLATIQAIT